jgi:serine/threonine-protein kinase RsbW
VIVLRVPGALAYRNLALRVVTVACKMAFGQDAEQEGSDFEAQAVSAFGEAFNNIAIHGYEGRAPGPVEIDLQWTHDELVVKITDEGRSFDPGSVDPPDLDELPEGGMGLFIMRSFVDSLDYQPGPPNVLRLVKRIHRSGGELTSPPPPPVATPGDDGGGVRAGSSSGGSDRPAARSGWKLRAIVPDVEGGGASGNPVERAAFGARRS